MGYSQCQFGILHKELGVCRCTKTHQIQCPSPDICSYPSGFIPKHRKDVDVVHTEPTYIGKHRNG